jgi:ABC-type nitrate/sulfonate/bicarbonate transport system permease component
VPTAWELAGRYGLTGPLFLVPVSSVAEAPVQPAASGELQHHLLPGSRRAPTAWRLAIAVGPASFFAR